MSKTPDAGDSPDSKALSRRRFLRGAGGVAAGGVLAQGLIGCAEAPARATAQEPPEPAAPAGGETLEGELEIELSINGQARKLRCEPRTTLLSALRHRCEPALTGTKEVCDRGNCGACTVHVDGKPALACLLLAVDQRGKQITTIEGLGSPEKLSALQQSFWTHDGQMCGFCTPGFVMSIQACLDKQPKASLEEIKRSCSGNICRCGTYPAVFEAALAVARGGK
ncbi:MAG: (2Fe-2S)-binding protein [Planctomycetes bacterium]|nr:(2Fe-2S)-binding protein [Planctomycetota bacterium]